MRLIDADALIDKYGDWYTEEGTEEGYIGTIKGIVDSMPTIEPERKKGKWLRYGEDGYPNNEDTVFWQCDQCLEQYTGRTKRIPNYCPNCGVRMEETK